MSTKILLVFSALALFFSSQNSFAAGMCTAGAGGGSPEGNNLRSTGKPSGMILESDGANGAKWVVNALPGSCITLAWGNITGLIENQGDLINLINGKATALNPILTGIIGTALTPSRVIVTDSSGNLAVSSITAANLLNFDISSSLTSLLATKSPIDSPAFTTQVTLPTGAGVLKSDSAGLVSSGTVNLTSQIAGILPYANGGTNATTANAAVNNLLPTQTSNSGKFLTTDGTNSSWATFNGANRTLANLSSPTAINQNLLMATDNTYTIGDDSGSSGVGASRPSVVDTPRINSNVVCFGENSSTGSVCLVRVSNTSMAISVGGVSLFTFSNGAFTTGSGSPPGDINLGGALQYNSRQKVTVTAGGSGSITASDHKTVFFIHSTGTVSSYTLTLPPNPVDGQKLTITADQIVTTLTLTPNSGQTIVPTYSTLTKESPIYLLWENQYGEWVAGN